MELTKLTITLKTNEPVLVKDIVDMLTGLNSEYNRFAFQATKIEGRKLKLHLNEVRKGSLIFEMIDMIPTVIAGIEGLNNIYEFTDHLKETFEKFKNKPDNSIKKESSDIDHKSIKNLSKIIKPVLNDRSTQIVFSAQNQENHIHYHITTTDASNIEKNIVSNKILLEQDPELIRRSLIEEVPTSLNDQVNIFYKTKVLFYLDKTNEETLGIIESISGNPLRVIFESNLIESSIQTAIKVNQDIAFLVDVQVETVRGQPWVYKITRIYETVKRPTT